MTTPPEDNPDVAAAGTGANATPASHAEPILIFDAPTEEEAEVVRATLEAAGIHAFLQNPNPSAGAGMLAETVGDTWSNGVFVAASDVEAARAILNAPPPSDAELTAEEESDPTTLEEAEARIKHT